MSGSNLPLVSWTFDMFQELDERYTAVLESANFGLVPQHKRVPDMSNDSLVVSLSYDKAVVSENNEQFSLIFNLSQPAPVGGVRIVFSTIDSDRAFGDITSPLLTNASNFESLSPLRQELTRSAITINEGATTASLSWRTIADSQFEGNEVTLAVLHPDAGYVVNPNQRIDSVIIKDSPRSTLSIPIQNAGFEDPILEDFTFTIVPPPGWELYNPDGLVPAETTDETSSTGAFNPSIDNYPAGVPEGNNVGNIFLIDEIGSGQVGLSQTLDTRLARNTRYTLSVEVGNPTGDDPVPGISFPGFPGYRVELLAGGQVLAADNNSLTIADGTFGSSTVTYATSATDPLLGQPLEIRLINLLQGPGIEVDFDDVRLTAEAISPRCTKFHRPNTGFEEPFNSLCTPFDLNLPLTVGFPASLFG